jgi:hypothetical protein
VTPDQRPVPSDTWTVKDKAGTELARVQGATYDDAVAASRTVQEVRDSAAREGGVAMRRLFLSELDIEAGA